MVKRNWSSAFFVRWLLLSIFLASGIWGVSEADGQIVRPEGWTEKTHGDSADPNYNAVFSQDEVKRIDLIIDPTNWQAMLDDMTEKYGPFGPYGCGGPIVPMAACDACEGLQDGDPCGVGPMAGTCYGGMGPRVCAPEGMDVGPASGEIPPDEEIGRNPDPIYVPCTFRFEGKTWWYVGVRFKGQSSLMYPWLIGTTMKLPFRFDFDEFEDQYPEVQDQRFFGFKELGVANNFMDSSLLREKVVGDIFREAGIPAPQTAFYQVFVDYGEGPIYFGLYTMPEVPRRPMLETQFDDPDGNIYKPEGSGARWVTFDQESFAKKTNEEEADWSDVQAVFAALHASRSNPDEWRAGLEAVFDVDGFLRWLATNTVVQNWDTYGNMPQNYYIYSDPDDGLIHWIPWDNNLALGDGVDLLPPLSLSLDPTEVGEDWPLIRYLIDDPVYYGTYLAFVNGAIEGAFSVEKNQTRYQNAHDLIAPYVVGPEGELFSHTLLGGSEDFDTSLEELFSHVEARREAALGFLGSEGFDPPKIIINEIHYNPSRFQGGDEEYEFIEILNAGESAVSLSGYSLAKAVDFSFPQGTLITPGEYLVIAAMADTYGSQGYQVFEWASGRLANGGETLLLKDTNGSVIDYVDYDDMSPWYDDRSPWPLGADGNGPSLELVDALSPNCLSENWKASNVAGGTPGRPNNDAVTYTTKLYYPHVNSGGWLFETEICAINTRGDTSLRGIFRAYDSLGKPVSEDILVTLPPHGRCQITVGDDFVNPGSIRYVIFEADSDGAVGYLKFYVSGMQRLAVPAVLESEVNSGDMYMSHIASNMDWWTGISLLNTTSTKKNLTIEFDNGTTITRNIEAYEHHAFTVKDLFGGEAQPNINSAVIKNGEGIVGLELFGSNVSSGNSYLSGVPLKYETTTNIYYPHIADDSTWWSGIVAYNPSSTSCDLTITPFSDDGTLLSPQTISLDGQEKYIGTAKELNFPDGTAWFRIIATSPITGFELFGTNNGELLAGYTGVCISGIDGVFAKIEKDGWTGIAFVNIEDSPATVIMTAYDDSGNVISTTTININAYEKVVEMASDLFAQDISTATYISYSSNREVVGFQLNGSSEGMMLDGLPGLDFWAVE